MDIQANYNPVMETDLCVAMKAVSAEIAGPDHNYTTLYSPIVEPVRDTPLRLFHFGLRPSVDASGQILFPAASLQGWRRYFPNAAVFGADDLSQNVVELPNIHTYSYSLADPSGLAKLWSTSELEEEFDIIIDNGINHPHANAYCFENSIHKLKVGGVYIIENVHWKTGGFWVDTRVRWERVFNHFEFRFLSIPHPTNTENNIVILAKKVAAAPRSANTVTPSSLTMQEIVDNMSKRIYEDLSNTNDSNTIIGE